MGGGGCLGILFFTLRGLGPLAFFFRRNGTSDLGGATGRVPSSGAVGCKADSSACEEKNAPWVKGRQKVSSEDEIKFKERYTYFCFNTKSSVARGFQNHDGLFNVYDGNSWCCAEMVS